MNAEQNLSIQFLHISFEEDTELFPKKFGKPKESKWTAYTMLTFYHFT